MEQTNPRLFDRVYEDFEPSYEWAQDEECDTLILILRGFRSENLRVQVSPSRTLKLRGEQKISENKWRRFSKEFTIPSDSNTNGIKAKLEGGFLYVRLPKSITQVKSTMTTAMTMPNDEAPNPEGLDMENQREHKIEAKHESTNIQTQKRPRKKEKESEVSPKKAKKEEDLQPRYYERKDKGNTGDDNNVLQDRVEATNYSETHQNMFDGLVKGEKNDDQRASMTPKLLVVMILILVMGIYVKNAIKASFGGSNIQEF